MDEIAFVISDDVEPIRESGGFESMIASMREEHDFT